MDGRATTTADGTHPKTHAKRSPSPASPPLDDPRAIVMDDKNLHTMITVLDSYLADNVPHLKQMLSRTEPLATSIALVRAGLYYLVEARALAARERDPEQRERRHARRLELVGLAYAGARTGRDRPRGRAPGLAPRRGALHPPGVAHRRVGQLARRPVDASPRSQRAATPRPGLSLVSPDGLAPPSPVAATPSRSLAYHIPLRSRGYTRRRPQGREHAVRRLALARPHRTHPYTRAPNTGPTSA